LWRRSSATAKERLQAVVEQDRSGKESFLASLRDDLLQVCQSYLEIGTVGKFDLQLAGGRLLISCDLEVWGLREEAKGEAG